MKRTSSIRLVASLAICMIVTGCQQPEPVVKPVVLEENDWSIDEVLPISQYHIGGRSVLNRPIVYQTLGFGQDVVMILATIHGNESAGTPLVRYLANYLQKNPDLLEGRTVVLVPVANPDGMAHHTRHNARGIDLNRNFAAMNRINTVAYGSSGQSEPESAFIDRLLQQHRPDRIVTIHQPLDCVDYDGPARDLAERMARKCRLPLNKLGSRPGSLGAYAGETLGIPIVTFEMRAGDSALSDVQLWNYYGQALLEAVKY